MSRHIFMLSVVLSKAPLHSLGHNDQSEVKQEFLVMYWHFYQYCCYVEQTATSMAPLCEDNWNKVWHDSFGHIMLLAPVPTSHDTGIVNDTILLGQDDWNKVQHDVFGHMMAVLASHDTAGIINSTITFVCSRWSKWVKHDFFSPVGTCISIMVCQEHCW